MDVVYIVVYDNMDSGLAIIAVYSDLGLAASRLEQAMLRHYHANRPFHDWSSTTYRRLWASRWHITAEPVDAVAIDRSVHDTAYRVEKAVTDKVVKYIEKLEDPWERQKFAPAPTPNAEVINRSFEGISPNIEARAERRKPQ